MPLMTGSNWIQLRCISDNFRLRQLNEVTKKESLNCVNTNPQVQCHGVYLFMAPCCGARLDMSVNDVQIILRRNSDHRPMLTFCSLLIKWTNICSPNLGGQGKLIRRTGVSSVGEQSSKYFNYSGFCELYNSKI